MTLYYLNPDDEPRECACSVAYQKGASAATIGACPICHGTGRLGNPEALTFRIDESEACERACCADGGDLGACEAGWYWAALPDLRVHGGPHPTEAAAVEAARRALGGGRAP